MGAKRTDFAGSTPLDDPGREAERIARLATQWQEVTHHEGLVCFFAVRYKKMIQPILTLNDLKSAGRLGALRAVQRRDPTMKSCQWRRFLAFWIRRAIQDSISSQAVPIKLPSIENRKSMERHRPDKPALAAVRRILDHPVFNVFFEPNVPEPDRLEPVDTLIARESHFILHAAVEALPGPEREIIKASFGFDCEPCTGRAIAVRDGISSQAIQQRKQRALSRLKYALKSRV